MKQKENRTCGFCKGEGDYIVHFALDSAENIYEICPICRGKDCLTVTMAEGNDIIPQKFIEFIEEIVVDGNWEYGDGTSMTEDAKIALAEIQRWYNLTIATPSLTHEQ